VTGEMVEGIYSKDNFKKHRIFIKQFEHENITFEMEYLG
jgi:hypothetical protein